MAKKNKKYVEEPNQFTKTDMQRLGIFKELGYTTINDKFKRTNMSFNESAGKGKQMLSEGIKVRDATQAGYFDHNFTRVFEGEGYSDPVRLSRQNRNKAKLKNLAKDWTPNNGLKMPCGLGSFCPCINASPEAFSPSLRTFKAVVEPKKNFFTNPAKHGTGYGYIDVTIGKYPEYKPDNYNAYRDQYMKAKLYHDKSQIGKVFKLGTHPQTTFNQNPWLEDRVVKGKRFTSSTAGPVLFGVFKPSSPAKRDGGMKAGTIDPYPEHSADVYTSMAVRYYKDETNKWGRTYYPPEREKTMPMSSVLQKNIDRTVNNLNYRTIQSVLQY